MTTEMNSPAATAAEPGWTPRLVGIVAALVGIYMIATLTFSIGAQVIPQIAERFDTTQAAWTVAAEMLAAAILGPFVGRLADLYGKKRVLLTVMSVGLTGSLFAAFAPNFAIFLVGRVLQGVGVTGAVLATVIVSEAFPVRVRAVATSIVVTASGVPAAALGFGTGWILDHFDLMILWLSVAGLTAAVLVLAAFVIPNRAGTGQGRVDVLGALLLGGTLGAILAGISLGPEAGWASPLVLALLLTGIVLATSWVVSALRSREPLIDLRVFGDSRSLTATILGYFLGASMPSIVLIALSTVAFVSVDAGLGYGLGVGATGFALMQFAQFTGFAIGGAIGGHLVRRFEPEQC